jgi:hypothetical protein
MKDLLWFIGMLSLVVVLVAAVGRIEYSDGYAAGHAVGHASIKTTDQQCVAWLFNANLKDVKKRICR